MRQTVVADFDVETWQTKCLPWARAVKAAGLDGLVVDYGLEAPAKDILLQMNIEVVAPAMKIGNRFCDTLFVLAESDRDGLFMYAKELPPRCKDMLAAAVDGGLVGLLRDDDFEQTLAPIDTLVFPLTSIEARIRAAESITNNVVKRLGGIIDADVVCARYEDWRRFVGFLCYAVAVAQIEPRFGMADLYLNYYGSYFPGTVKAFK